MRIQGYIALLAIVSILLFLILYFGGYPAFADYPLYVALTLGGIPLVIDLLRKALAFEFGSDLLAGLSIVTSVILGEYLAGTLVVLMLSGGEAIENYVIRKASKVLEALAKRAPTIAHRRREGKLEDIGIEEIAINDTLVIFPHEICPVDGEVVEGRGVMDESFLTGEPFMISKAPGAQVISGAVNGDDSLSIRAGKLAVDSRYAKIMEVMRESEQKRPRMRRLADQLGAWYTPLAILIGLLAWQFSGESVRFLAVLVVATPCPLLIAIPVAIIGSISISGSRGILIKNPVVLEQFSACKTMILDKTGTLTYGTPTLTDQIVYNGMEKREILRLAASLEQYSKHPLASAIQKEAHRQGIELALVEEISEKKGEGLQGVVDHTHVEITGRKKVAAQLPRGTGLECVILINQQLAAYYRFHDAPRKESELFVQHLPVKHGFQKVMIVSGDRQEEVEYLAKEVGIRNVHAGMSPEQKVEIVANETARAKTAYLGDGINDAPALVAANVGIAIGLNSDIAAEAAGAVIMDNSLEKVDEFLHISSRMRKIALESALGGMGLSLIGMGVAAFGFLPPVAGAITQEVIDVAAIFNALRTIYPPSRFTDME